MEATAVEDIVIPVDLPDEGLMSPALLSAHAEATSADDELQKPILAGGRLRPTSDGPEARVWEILAFFQAPTSRRLDVAGAYHGTIVWELSDGYDTSCNSSRNQQRSPPLIFAVRLPADASTPVQTWFGPPEDGIETVRVHMSVEDFLYVYSGRASAAAIARMLLTGRARAPWRGLRDVQAFAQAFDYSVGSWVASLRACGDHAAADRLLRGAWASALAAEEKGSAGSDATAMLASARTLIDEDGRPCVRSSLPPRRAARLAAMGAVYLAGGATAEATAAADALLDDTGASDEADLDDERAAALSPAAVRNSIGSAEGWLRAAAAAAAAAGGGVDVLRVVVPDVLAHAQRAWHLTADAAAAAPGALDDAADLVLLALQTVLAPGVAGAGAVAVVTDDADARGADACGGIEDNNVATVPLELYARRFSPLVSRVEPALLAKLFVGADVTAAGSVVEPAQIASTNVAASSWLPSLDYLPPAIAAVSGGISDAGSALAALVGAAGLGATAAGLPPPPAIVGDLLLHRVSEAFVTGRSMVMAATRDGPLAPLLRRAVFAARCSSGADGGEFAPGSGAAALLAALPPVVSAALRERGSRFRRQHERAAKSAREGVDAPSMFLLPWQGAASPLASGLGVLAPLAPAVAAAAKGLLLPTEDVAAELRAHNRTLISGWLLPDSTTLAHAAAAAEAAAQQRRRKQAAAAVAEVASVADVIGGGALAWLADPFAGWGWGITARADSSEGGTMLSQAPPLHALLQAPLQAPLPHGPLPPPSFVKSHAEPMKLSAAPPVSTIVAATIDSEDWAATLRARVAALTRSCARSVNEPAPSPQLTDVPRWFSPLLPMPVALSAAPGGHDLALPPALPLLGAWARTPLLSPFSAASLRVGEADSVLVSAAAAAVAVGGGSGGRVVAPAPVAEALLAALGCRLAPAVPAPALTLALALRGGRAVLEPVLHGDRLSMHQSMRARARAAAAAAPHQAPAATAPLSPVVPSAQPQPCAYVGLGAGVFAAAACARLRLLAGDALEGATVGAFSASESESATTALRDDDSSHLPPLYSALRRSAHALALAVGAPASPPLLHLELPRAPAASLAALAVAPPDADAQAVRLPRGMPMFRVRAAPSNAHEWLAVVRALFGGGSGASA